MATSATSDVHSAGMIWLCHERMDHLDRVINIDDEARYRRRHDGSEVLSSSGPRQTSRISQWCQLVEEFLRRRLNRPEDSIHAIAGLAEEFAISYQPHLGQYVAGHFSDHLETLTWERPSLPLKGPFKTPEQLAASSWSWLKSHERVHFPWPNELYKSGFIPQSLLRVKSIDVNCKEDMGPSHPYGPLEPGGSIALEVPTASAALVNSKEVHDEQGRTICRAITDFAEPLQCPTQNVKLAFLAKEVHPERGHVHAWCMIHPDVLVPAGDNKLERIGACTVLMTSGFQHFNRDFFDRATVERLTLV